MDAANTRVSSREVSEGRPTVDPLVVPRRAIVVGFMIEAPPHHGGDIGGHAEEAQESLTASDGGGGDVARRVRALEPHGQAGATKLVLIVGYGTNHSTNHRRVGRTGYSYRRQRRSNTGRQRDRKKDQEEEEE